MTTEADVNTRLTRLETSHEHLATKEDIANLRTDMANLRTEMANMKADLIRWMVGAVIAGLTASVGLTAVILRILGPWT
jgi:ADP-dependent phosphofructokinase/glucokinase